MADERARLEELRRFSILDTPPEPEFDRVTEIAARVCSVPMAVVALVDAGRQWFKARVGVAVDQTERALAFCAHTIEQTDPLVVADASTDPRFRDHPFVTGDPGIRSYHGVPLISRSGHAIGTLAVFDREPRVLDEVQAAVLDVLAEQVVALLEERRLRLEHERANERLLALNAELREAGRHSDGLFATNPLPMMIFDDETFEILQVNNAAVDLYGYDHDRFTELTLFDIRPAEDVAAAKSFLATDRPTLSKVGTWRHLKSDGTVFAVDITSHEVQHSGRRARLAVMRDLSDVEVAERRARAASEQLQSTFEVIADGVVVLDRDWNFAFVNPAAGSLLERDPAELTGRGIWDEFPDALDGPIEENLHRAMHGAVVEPFEVHWASTGRWGEIRVFPAEDGITAYFRDITERHRAAERADVTIQRLRDVVTTWRALSELVDRPDELHDAIARLAADVVGAEVGVWVVSGDDGDASIRSATRELDVERARAELGPLLDEAETALHVVRGESRGADSVLPPHLAGIPVRVVDGVLDGVLVLASDRPPGELDLRSVELIAEAIGSVLRRVESSTQLRDSEERFRLVSFATTDAIYDWDLRAGTVWWSDGMSTLFGWDPAELLPGSWEALLHEDDHPRTLAAMNELVSDPARSTMLHRYRFRCADGRDAWVDDRSYVVRDDAGRAVRLVGGMSDVTTAVEVEMHARRSQRLEAVGELTGGVAHDFNNLLTVVLGAMDELVADLSDRPDRRELALMARSAALRGAELAHRLLAFARRQPLEPRAVDVTAVLVEIEELIRRTLPEDVDFEVERRSGLPAAYVDPGQLESAVLNLCINARDAMPDGGHLLVRTRRVELPPDSDHERSDAGTVIWYRSDPVGIDPDLDPGTYVEISVADTGHGIDPAVIAQVFEPFFSTKPAGTGSGLGLSMVHGFVHQSHGRIDLRSAVGVGTTVRMLLPTAAADTSVGITTLLDTPLIGRRAAHDFDSFGARILLVEDEDLVRRTAARHLRSLGYEVITAASADDAIDILGHDGAVDLVFTDVVMPGSVGGLALGELVRREHPGVAVLYTSGYAPGAMDDDGHLDPEVNLLVKPYRLAELGRRVRAALDRAAP